MTDKYQPFGYKIFKKAYKHRKLILPSGATFIQRTIVFLCLS